MRRAVVYFASLSFCAGSAAAGCSAGDAMGDQSPAGDVSSAGSVSPGGGGATTGSGGNADPQRTSGAGGVGTAGTGNGSAGASASAGHGGAGGSGAGTGGSGGTSSMGVAGSPGIGGALGIGGSVPVGTPPDLTPGVWKDITPPRVNLHSSFGVTVVEIDSTNTSTLYVSVDTQGLWRSNDRGATWNIVGDPSYKYTFNYKTTYIDSPIDVRVDPANAKHLYLTQGVRGASIGFWVSTDAGASWAQPPGFVDVQKTATNDVTNMSVDPTDFKHVLLSSHSPWAQGPTGILETKDGGMTFIKRAPGGSWGGSLGVNFLLDPAHGVGNSQTWLISTDGDGFWRTTDSGTTWSHVATFGAVHGGNRTLYYAKTGVVYAGALFQMARSTDNGLTWSLIGPKFNDGYYQVIGDGNTLYAQESNTGGHTAPAPQPYVTSPESDGITWTPYHGGAQTFSDGPYTMRFDPINRIIYSANWNSGLWALKVVD